MDWSTINKARDACRVKRSRADQAAKAERAEVYGMAFERAEKALQPTLLLAAQKDAIRARFDPESSHLMHYTAQNISQREVTPIQLEAVADWLRTWVDDVKAYTGFLVIQLGPKAWGWIAQRAASEAEAPSSAVEGKEE